MAIQALSDMVVVGVIIAALFLIAPWVSLTVFVVLALVAFFIYSFFRPWVDRLARRLRELEMAVNRHVTKALHGIKDVKVFGKEEPFLRRLPGQRLRLCPSTRPGSGFLTRSPTWMLETAGFAMLCAAVVLVMLVGMGSSYAKISGTVALLAVAAWRILPAVNRILAAVAGVRQSLPMSRQRSWTISMSLRSGRPPSGLGGRAQAGVRRGHPRPEGASFRYAGAEQTGPGRLWTW